MVEAVLGRREHPAYGYRTRHPMTDGSEGHRK